MNSGVIAARYVRAIERYARKADRSELLYKELDRLATGFEQVPGIGKTLCDPADGKTHGRLADGGRHRQP